jgi:hypothetical protein
MSLSFSKHAKERIEQRAGPHLVEVLIGLFSKEGSHRKVFFEGTLSAKKKKKKNWSVRERHVLVYHEGCFYVSIEDVKSNKVITFLTEDLYIRKAWGLNLSTHKAEILNKIFFMGSVFSGEIKEDNIDLVVESSRGVFSIDFKNNKNSINKWKEGSAVIPSKVALILVRDYSDILGDGPVVLKNKSRYLSTTKDILERIASNYRKKIN